MKMNFLPPEQKNLLQAQHRTEKNRPTADRIKAVLAANEGWSYKDIASILLLDQETISIHINEYLESSKLSKNSGGSESKLTEEQAQELIKHLEEKTYLRTADICAHVKAAYKVAYTINGITSWLHKNKFSFKKPKGTPSKADPLKQKEFIALYKKLLEDTPTNEPILFGDGVHPTMNTKLAYGWIRTGTDKEIPTTASRTRVNVFGSINLKTMDVVTTVHETIDSDAMDVHLKELRDKYPDAPLIHLILDQGSYNKSAQTNASAIKQKITIHLLPPYSPNLNPIERLWKVMNEFARNNRFFASAKEFRQAINDFFEITWPSIAKDSATRINDHFSPVGKKMEKSVVST